MPRYVVVDRKNVDHWIKADFAKVHESGALVLSSERLQHSEEFRGLETGAIQVLPNVTTIVQAFAPGEWKTVEELEDDQPDL